MANSLSLLNRNGTSFHLYCVHVSTTKIKTLEDVEMACQKENKVGMKVIIQTPSSSSPISSSDHACCFVGFLVSTLHVKSTVSLHVLRDSYTSSTLYATTRHWIYVHFIAYTSCLKMLKSSICHGGTQKM